MTDTETKALCAPFSLKSLDEGALTFKGLSSTWDTDLGGDQIHEGAFARSIGLFKSGAHRLYLTDGHPELEGPSGQRANRIIGKVIDAQETKAGLETQFQMVPDDPDAASALRRIKGGFLTDLSIAYKAVKSEREKGTGKRHITELKWGGVGLVRGGMNPHAQADPMSVKALVEQLQAGTVDDETKALLQAMPDELKAVLRALLDTPADPAPSRELAPESPQRLAIESLLRDLTLRRLATA